MNELNDKLSYLQGLMDGMDLDLDSKEGKLFYVMADILEDLVDAVDESFEYSEDLEDYITLIDEDLSDIEEEIYDIDYEDLDFVYDDVDCENCLDENCCED